MKKNAHLILICCIAFLCYKSYCTEQNNNKNSKTIASSQEYNERPMSKEEIERIKNSINTVGKRITAELKNQNMSYIEIKSKSKIINYWADSSNIVNATGISREWYKKVSAKLRELSSLKNHMEYAKRSSIERAKLNEYTSEYNETLDEYLKLVRNPEKENKNEKTK